MDTNATVASYALGIHPEDFDIFPLNQDLYCVDYNADQSAIVKVSRTFFTNYVGDLLVTEAGEVTLPARLFIVHWNGTNFVTRALSYHRQDGSSGHLEHVTLRLTILSQ